MERITDFDQEKTQACEPGELRDMRLKQAAYANECGMAARAMSAEEIVAEFFKYHPPTDETLPKFAAINQAAKNFAEIVLHNCSSGRDRARAIEMIRDARMVANACIALNGLSLY